MPGPARITLSFISITMDPLALILIFMAVGLGLIVAELFIPSGGILGIAAAGFIVAAVISAFFISPWAGLGLLLTILFLTPFVFSLVMRVWKNSRAGRAVILTGTTPTPEKPRAQLDSVGTTTSALRPMGEAQFGNLTFEVIAELGSLDRGTRVRVVDYRQDGVAVVRPA